MMRHSWLFLLGAAAFAQTPPTAVWKFAVSGDSRNCGDVVMPAIASAVSKTDAAFYWHLGDLRAVYTVDEDIARRSATPPSLQDYQMMAWKDFATQQMDIFKPLEFFLGIGNHETILPKTRELFVSDFSSTLNSVRLQKQREADKDTAAGPRTYYHWVMKGGVDFINLDNASGNTFDVGQMEWIRTRLAEDKKSQTIKTVIVGMHEALPGSKGLSHSMCDAPAGVERGKEVYNLLWDLQQSGKKVYLLASHSHFVMDDVYNTSYWKDKVLSGWIVGTAGAVRYRLPANVATGTISKTDVYGYLLASVMSDGTVRFEFKELGLADLRKVNGNKPDALIGWCFAENKDIRVPTPGACGND